MPRTVRLDVDGIRQAPENRHSHSRSANAGSSSEQPGLDRADRLSLKSLGPEEDISSTLFESIQSLVYKHRKLLEFEREEKESIVTVLRRKNEALRSQLRSVAGSGGGGGAKRSNGDGSDDADADSDYDDDDELLTELSTKALVSLDKSKGQCDSRKKLKALTNQLPDVPQVKNLNLSRNSLTDAAVPGERAKIFPSLVAKLTHNTIH
jgi:hypothetical protein